MYAERRRHPQVVFDVVLETPGVGEQIMLADQLRSVVARLHGVNRFDRDRLSDIVAAMRRKEAKLDEFLRAATVRTSV